MSQSPLFEHEFRTARPSRPVFRHQEFLDKLSSRRNEPIGKRASLLIQRMAVDIARLHYKATSGVNRGWHRSRLGGRSGSHFYAWWAPAGALPLKTDVSFEAASDEAVFLRDIRHHDDHTPLSCGSLANDYLPLNVSDLRSAEYAPEPWTNPQVRFARSHIFSRILRGHPGSGKTTALLHAADASQAKRVLYLTFSQDLAALARDYFDRFCSNARIFTVLTYPEFLHATSTTSSACSAPGRPNLTRFTTRSMRTWSAPPCPNPPEESLKRSVFAYPTRLILRTAPAILAWLPTECSKR